MKCAHSICSRACVVVATCGHCRRDYSDVGFMSLRLPGTVLRAHGPAATWREARQELPGMEGVEAELRDCPCSRGATLTAYARIGVQSYLTRPEIDEAEIRADLLAACEALIRDVPRLWGDLVQDGVLLHPIYLEADAVEKAIAAVKKARGRR